MDSGSGSGSGSGSEDGGCRSLNVDTRTSFDSYHRSNRLVSKHRLCLRCAPDESETPHSRLSWTKWPVNSALCYPGWAQGAEVLAPPDCQRISFVASWNVTLTTEPGKQYGRLVFSFRSSLPRHSGSVTGKRDQWAHVPSRHCETIKSVESQSSAMCTDARNQTRNDGFALKRVKPDECPSSL